MVRYTIRHKAAIGPLTGEPEPSRWSPPELPSGQRVPVPVEESLPVVSVIRRRV